MAKLAERALRRVWLSHKGAIRAFLETDLGWHAYALADLDEPFFSQCRWLAAQSAAGQIESLVLVFAGLTPPALLAMGRPDPLPEMLAEPSLPQTVMALGQTAHMEHIARAYRLDYRDPMYRMVLDGPLPPPETASPDIIRLDERHLPQLAAMYRGAHGNAFAPYQLRQGVFFGLQQGGELVSVAGTHIVSAAYGVAAVGNVFTRPQFRGRGFARQVTHAVCRELLARRLTIVLNVERANAPAVRVYQRLGFRIYGAFEEGVGCRKDKPQNAN